ncbi:uncharacterized protein C6orf163 homolog [Anneissia japonica]|uniref:uncharacterized protein C6orf163 homolog n=1 Tax=Anneissia japonica TaxID=1529436 RepID=UPI001425792A|nr:uncharacterized protein C6orf163 homolog [Anneissia japonica]
MNAKLRSNKALNPNYTGIPLRYEDSKPMMTQSFTHNDILGIGQSIHTKWEQDALSEREAAIRAAEDSVWAEGERLKDSEIQKVKLKCLQEKEKALKDLQTQHERNLKEEALRIEGEMQKMAIEQVRAERESGESILRETVQKAIAKCEEERIKAIEDTRDEEKTLASKEAARVAKEVAKQREAAAKLSREDRANALMTIEKRLTDDKNKAVCDAQKTERQKAATEIQRLKQLHAKEISKLETRIKEEKVAHKLTENQLELITKEKDMWIKKHEHLKESYQLFIDETKGFQSGQADFLLK